MGFLGSQQLVSNTILNKNGNRGQSTVEYIMLLSMIAVLAISVLNNARVRAFLGPESKVLENIRTYMEYAYRTGSTTSSGAGQSFEYSGFHDSYYNTQEGMTRFFTTEGRYPD